MKLQATALALALICFNAAAAVGVPVTQLLPQPQTLELAPAASAFTLDLNVRVVAPAALAGPARSLASSLGLRTAGDGERVIRFIVDPALAGKVEGGYRLNIRAGEISIHAAEAAGAFNATQTLLQMLPPGKVSKASLPALDISDAPRFAWRGLTLDVARHFFGVPTIKRVLDSMAAYKLNRLHLHLTDDTGWRVAIKGYPKLTSVGARGDASNPKGPVQSYTAEDIRTIVRYAAERHIEVVPEIEMPGHAGAAARSYPEFFDGATFNPGNPGTYAFIDAVLGEVAALFPSRYLHFGGDEVFVEGTGWGKRAEVLAMAKQLDPTSAAPNLKAVEAEFARRVVALIRKHGRTPMGWDEVISAGLNADTLVQWWRFDKPEVMRKALAQGQSVVLSPAEKFYLDYPQGLGEPGAPWEGNNGGPMSVEKIVGWEPVPADLSAEHQARILGVEASMWTEFVRSEAYLEFMLYPRMAAVAEVAWRMQARSEPAAFAERLAPHIARWRTLGRNVRGEPGDAFKYLVH